MQERVWIHVPEIHQQELERWKEYLKYHTVDMELGRVAVYEFITNKTEDLNFKQFTKERNIRCIVSRREYSFTKAEKDQADILYLIIDGNGGDSTSDESLYYTCPTCMYEVRKVNRSRVRVDYKEVSKYDICISYLPNCEVVVSQKLIDLMVGEKISGYETTPIYQTGTDEVIPNFYQLLLNTGLGEAVAPTIVERGIRCVDCGFYTRNLIKSLLHYKKLESRSYDICYASDWYGDIYRNKYVGSRAIVISQKLYRIMKENKIRAFSVQPAAFIFMRDRES
ncbi:hypothetical protein ACFO9Q_21125 [Paenibacillus sp. GCM10023252]|uniref:hypothetical protein n=1 Tax=Paenibacillus sp. GCM10023252 TaxID=3252649 RepID=UPI00360606D5